jgi:hypothetical protein
MGASMKSTRILCLSVLVAAAVPAQTSSRPAAPKATSRPRLEDLRRPTGDTLKLNAQVQVRLRNGERVRGLVKAGKFVERAEGLGFEDAERKAHGAGIRIWYYDSTNSYIFIEYEQIESCSVIRRLSDVEVREISDRMEAQAKVDRERLSQIDAARMQALKDKGEGQKKDGELGKKLEDLTKKEDEAEKLRKLRDKADALLKEFPPEEGWSAEKLRDIQVKKVAVGAFPDAKSRKFVEVYEDWKAAHELRQKEEGEKTKDDGKGKQGETGAAGSTPAPTPEPGSTPAKPKG